jgi:glucose/mannose-6-phosphate isomerase
MVNIDDITTIEKIDKSNMRKLLYDFPSQVEKVSQLMESVAIPSEYGEVGNIVITGMGGSGVGGNLLKGLLRDRIKIPLEVNKSYTLSNWVDSKTLLICVSYSGNTEEALSAYEVGKTRGSKMIVISSGGELAKLAKKDKFPLVLVPESNIPPRTALGYLFFSQVFILKKLGLVNIKDKEITETIQVLKSLREEIAPEKVKTDNTAKRLAGAIYDTIPLVYATSDYFEGVAMRWKTQINENSKNPVYSVCFPELDHNEIMGWEGAKELIDRFSLVILRDKEETERMAKRIDITSSLIKGKAAKVLDVYSRGKKLLSRMLSLVYIGDYVSFYLAIFNGMDPTTIESIANLKKEMGKK